jgi:hypothetical protein
VINPPPQTLEVPLVRFSTRNPALLVEQFRDFPGSVHINFSKIWKVKLSLYSPWRPLGLREVEAPTFSGIRLTDGDKFVSPTRRPLFTPRKIPGTHFC